MNIFLRAKHWQLFLLMFGLPLVISFVFVGLVIYYIFNSDGDVSPEIVFDEFFYILMAAFISNSTLLFWQWSVAIRLQDKIPDSLKLKTTWFKIFFFISIAFLIYVMLTMVLFLETFNGIQDEGFAFGLAMPDFITHAFLDLLIQLLSMVAFFGCIYVVAKTIKIVELQREVKVADFVAEFLMVWFSLLEYGFFNQELTAL